IAEGEWLGTIGTNHSRRKRSAAVVACRPACESRLSPRHASRHHQPYKLLACCGGCAALPSFHICSEGAEITRQCLPSCEGLQSRRAHQRPRPERCFTGNCL